MRTIIVVLILLTIAVSAPAAPPPWTGRMSPPRCSFELTGFLYGKTTTDCPLIYNDVSRTLCLWLSALTLSCGDDNAKFSQTWASHAPDTWIELPGNNRLWPQEVTVNGQAVPIGRQQDRPGAKGVCSPGLAGPTDHPHSQPPGTHGSLLRLLQ